MKRNESNSRRKFLKSALVGTAGGLLGSQSLQQNIFTSSDSRNASRPNIVLIMSDDQGYADVSCYEHSQDDVHTPNIDRIAEGGVKCTNAYVSAPVCSPSRAGLMTGRYQQRFGSYTHFDSRLGLPVDQLTIADLMRHVDYSTYMVGKWHLGFQHEYYPVNRGFDDFYGFLGGVKFYDPELMIGDAVSRQSGYLTDLITDASLKFIDDHKEEPFFLYFAHRDPHTPMDPPPEKYLQPYKHIENEERRIGLAKIKAVDDSVGMVLDKLEELGLEENTLVFFLSDNGGSHANGSINAPLRSRKGRLWEGGIRVPFLAKWPARLPADTTCDETVISLDILPTCVAAAGGDLPTTRAFDGKNLIPSLRGDNREALHQTLFWTFQERDWGEQWAIRHRDWKLVHEDGRLHLSNLAEDIEERSNLMLEYPRTAEELLQRYWSWRSLMAPHRLKNPESIRDNFIDREGDVH